MNAFATHLPVVVITGGCGYRCQLALGPGPRPSADAGSGTGTGGTGRGRRLGPAPATYTGGPPPRGGPPPTGSVGGDSVGGGGVMVRSIAGGISVRYPSASNRYRHHDRARVAQRAGADSARGGFRSL